ncbi:MAG: ABC transporter substrate-binding protein, partial [Acidimicrobiales bacterium]|nr:ABC transporter substrate-binding protein [Acidimicrobiales bacterium]
KEKKPGARVAQLIFNNDFGKAYQETFTEAAKKNGLELVETRLHEGTAPNLDNEIAAILAAKPDFVIGGTTGAFCSRLMGGLAKGGFKGQTIISSTCASTASFFRPIDPAGEGVLVLTSLVDPSNPANASDDDVKTYKADVAKYGAGANANDTNIATGWVQAQTAIGILKAAAESDDGLTRISAMNAAWNLNETPPLLFGPVTLDGNSDAYGVETLEFYKYSSASKSLEPTGEKFDLQGKTGLFGE